MNVSPIERIRQMSQGDLAVLGLQGVAYVRPFVTPDGAAVFAIHAADGTRLAVVASEAHALAALREHELEPVSVH
jgi:hypothetical protein